MSKKALIAMSGGVDSGVAAYLIKQQGYDCLGCTMLLHQNRDAACSTTDDVADAKAVADHLQIPHHTYDFSADFRDKVIDNFVCCYENGMTPNPCIECNRHLKFARLFAQGQALGCDYIVTGHYARIIRHAERFVLQKAVDESKDQTYVLYSLTQEQLAHTLLPLGALSKAEVRNLAAQQGFSNAHKAESQDICFVPDGKYAEFIERHTGKTYPTGDFIDTQGHKLGRHRGIIRYTVGQRRGLGLAMGQPVYVVAINPADNTVIVGPDEELYCSRLTAHHINLMAVEKIERPMRLQAKIRYNQRVQWATVQQTAEDELLVEFDQPQRAIARGQAVVLYDGDIVVGGGRID